MPEESSVGEDVYSLEEAEGVFGLPRGSPEAHVTPPRPGPQHSHVTIDRIAQRGEELLHEQNYTSQR